MEEAQERVRAALLRNVRALELKPSLARGSAVTRVTVRDGLTCDIEEGRFHLVADMHAKHGGGDEGPNPGVYGRAALGSCLAVGYMMFAAQAGVAIDRLEVQVEADYDARPELGMSDEQPGYEQIRVTVDVTSPEPEERVRAMLADAEAHSPYLAVFRKPQDVRVRATVRAPAGDAASAPAVPDAATSSPGPPTA